MESGNLRRALKAKSHLSVENANLRAEVERLRAALESLLLIAIAARIGRAQENHQND